MKPMTKRQGGFFLIEALLAILIFTLGILGMVAMGGTAINSQSTAQYRTDAATLTNELGSLISVRVNRATPADIQNSLAAFQHLPAGGNCAFNGAASADPTVVAWLARVTAAGLVVPGNPNAVQVQVTNNAAGFNRVQITLCWRTPADLAPRQHVLVTYVN
jgi:type IV pilus assembly protein PilV